MGGGWTAKKGRRITMTGHDDRRTTSLVVLPQRSLAAMDRSLEAMTTRSIENSSMYLKRERERENEAQR